VAKVWTNWVGNQSFEPRGIAVPRDEREVIALVRETTAAGGRLRAAGAGHSFSPLVETDGVVMSQTRLTGIRHVDQAAGTVTLLAGTTIAELGEALWEAGLSLANQGDIDTQTIAGAISTGTHGSGVRLGSLSSTVVGGRLVTAGGELLELGAWNEDMLRAAQVSLGSLGVFTELVVQAVPAYHLDEWIGLLPVEEVLERWDELRDGHRHFSFFWLPTDASGQLYGLNTGGVSAADRCYVKLYDDAPGDTEAPAGHRIDRSYRIFPSVFEKNFHEMEHMLPLGVGRDAFIEIREIVRRRFPDCIFPVEIRFTAPDSAMLSPNYETATTVVSVSGKPGTDYWPFLRAVDDIVERYEGRPHWGKLHFTTPERAARLFPELEHFRAIRRELDPSGVFLNDHLRPLLS
jgi:FAD/FMN-containing dehydrogenase